MTKTYTDYQVMLVNCYGLIEHTIRNQYEDYYCYDNLQEKMDRDCFVSVANAITLSHHHKQGEGVYYNTDVGDTNSISNALDDYLRDVVLTEQLDGLDFISVVNDAFDDYNIDWLALLDDFIEENGSPNSFKPHILRNILKVYLGQKIYEQGLTEIREKFIVSLNKAVVSLQRAIKRRVNKRQVNKVLESKLSHIDPSTFYPLISKWI